MFVRPCKLMISYVNIKYILELQNVANGDFLKMKYRVNIVVFFAVKYPQFRILTMLKLAVSNEVYMYLHCD